MRCAGADAVFFTVHGSSHVETHSYGRRLVCDRRVARWRRPGRVLHAGTPGRCRVRLCLPPGQILVCAIAGRGGACDPIAGNVRGILPWGTCAHAFAPADEVELIAEPGQGGWAFGRFGARFDAVAGSARVFTLEIVETMPEDRGMAVQRNWVARFREIGFTEAGPGLAKLRATESPAGR